MNKNSKIVFTANIHYKLFSNVKGCIRPSVVQYGSTNLTDTNTSLFPVGTVLQYSCDPGYMLVGRSILTCTTIGDWSSNLPRCIRSDGKIKKKKKKENIILNCIMHSH